GRPAIKAVEGVIFGAYGVMLTPPDWLVSTSPTYQEAYEIEHLVSRFKGSSMHQERADLDSLWVSIASSEDI
ncbi:Hypothetical protein FKW44_022219, partial [Caligus rogercresseyi]